MSVTKAAHRALLYSSAPMRHTSIRGGSVKADLHTPDCASALALVKCRDTGDAANGHCMGLPRISSVAGTALVVLGSSLILAEGEACWYYGEHRGETEKWYVLAGGMEGRAPKEYQHGQNGHCLFQQRVWPRVGHIIGLQWLARSRIGNAGAAVMDVPSVTCTAERAYLLHPCVPLACP